MDFLHPGRKLFLTAAVYDMDLRSQPKCSSRRVHGNVPAAHHSNLFQSLGVAGNSERSYKILNVIALVEVIQLFGSRADYLKDNGYSAFFAVKIRNGERYSLAVRVNAQYNELPRLRFRGDHGSVHLHQRYGRIEHFFGNNFVHKKITPYSCLASGRKSRHLPFITIISYCP